MKTNKKEFAPMKKKDLVAQPILRPESRKEILNLLEHTKTRYTPEAIAYAKKIMSMFENDDEDLYAMIQHMLVMDETCMIKTSQAGLLLAIRKNIEEQSLMVDEAMSLVHAEYIKSYEKIENLKRKYAQEISEIRNMLNLFLTAIDQKEIERKMKLVQDFSQAMKTISDLAETGKGVEIARILLDDS